ncbi:MAG: DUF370 domain-containing protein [Oscillospiraceae bacterium]|nr:DUF370 domain-containing protein [Oscillospiraceae bacterium]
MYLHIGQNAILQTQDIIGIFDLDNSSRGKDTRNLLAKSEREGKVYASGGALPRSFVLLADGAVYLTPISTATIVKRRGKSIDNY